MTDEIIREVWHAKELVAREFNYDIDALAVELRKRTGLATKGRKLLAKCRLANRLSKEKLAGESRPLR